MIRLFLEFSEKWWSNEKLAMRWLCEVLDVKTKARYVLNV